MGLNGPNIRVAALQIADPAGIINTPQSHPQISRIANDRKLRICPAVLFIQLPQHGVGSASSSGFVSTTSSETATTDLQTLRNTNPEQHKDLFPNRSQDEDLQEVGGEGNRDAEPFVLGDPITPEASTKALGQELRVDVQVQTFFHWLGGCFGENL